ncbi:MAG TPA: hypothetical protein VFF27_01000, partial [Bacteroidia bacterium]|nr:hypothetical protein [Bacteroidia bacterium]
MKKILLSLAVTVISTLAANAQVDYGFETWVPAGSGSTIEDPKGWASFNVVAALPLGMQQTVFKETTAPYAGNAAAKIVTQPVPALAQVQGYDTVGLLIVGKVDVANQKIYYGTPYTARNASFKFATKYQPVGLDTGWVDIELTKWNATKSMPDVIAKGKWTSSATTTAWTSYEVVLTYDPDFANSMPDSLRIIASSSSLYRPKVGSTLYIDDITSTGWVSTNELPGINNNVTVFPVPASQSVSFTSTLNATIVEILDLAGRKVGSFQM